MSEKQQGTLQLNSYEREWVSDTTRVLLCDFAAADMERPLHDKDVDWEEAFAGLCRNGLIGLAYHYLSQHEEQASPPQEFRDMVQQAYRGDAIRMTMMYHYIGQTLAQLTASGIEFMVIKGPVLAHTVYPQPFLRAFNDLDLVVRERDWAAMHRQLTEMNFVSEENLTEPPPKFAPGAVFYEQKYWHRETEMLVEVHYDDLLCAGLASRDVEGFWQRAVPVGIEGQVVKALSLEDQLLHLCAHAHYHAYTRLNWFSDILIIVRDHAEQLNWDRFSQTVRQEEAQVCVYYTLHYAEELFDHRVPPRVLSAVYPDAFRRWWHERYLPQEQVLSLLPMWRPDLSFYFRPLYKRLLPDLLIMGRRKEKIAALLRLLVPSVAWLRYYYHLDEDQSVLGYWLLHPLKLLYHYFVETATAIRTQDRARQDRLTP